MSSVFDLLTAYGSAYRSNLRSNIEFGVTTAMDSVLAITLGLGLRLLLDVLGQHDIRIEGSLVGLWEGLVLFHFLQKWPRSYDPYLGFGFRLFVDFLLTENLPKMIVVLLWTGVGMVMSDVGPTLFQSASVRRLYRKISRDVVLDVAGLRSLAKPSVARVRFSSPSRDSPTSLTAQIAPTSTSPTAAFSFTTSVRSRPLPGSFPGDADTETAPSVSGDADASEMSSSADMVSHTQTTGLQTTGTESLTSETVEDSEDDGSTPTNHPVDIPDEYDDEDLYAEELLRRPPIADMPVIPDAPAPPSPPPAPLASPLVIPPQLDTLGPEHEQEAADHGAALPKDEETESKRDHRQSMPETEFAPESVISGGSDVEHVLRRAAELRTLADAEDVVRDKLKADLEDARREKRWGDAFMLMLEHRKTSDKAQGLHGKAARRFFHANNQDKERETLVVRHLRLEEAMRLIESTLGEMWSSPSSENAKLWVDVGLGEVKAGSWPLKQAIMHELNDNLKLPTEVDPKDSSVLIISRL